MGGGVTQLQLQLQCLARQSRATRKGARGSWGNQNKTSTRQNTIKKRLQVELSALGGTPRAE